MKKKIKTHNKAITWHFYSLFKINNMYIIMSAKRIKQQHNFSSDYIFVCEKRENAVCDTIAYNLT